MRPPELQGQPVVFSGDTIMQMEFEGLWRRQHGSMKGEGAEKTICKVEG
jgi:hypothetical protein